MMKFELDLTQHTNDTVPGHEKFSPEILQGMDYDALVLDEGITVNLRPDQIHFLWRELSGYLAATGALIYKGDAYKENPEAPDPFWQGPRTTEEARPMTKIADLPTDELGAEGDEVDLVEFKNFVSNLMERRSDLTEGEAIDLIWGRGDYLANAARLGVDGQVNELGRVAPSRSLTRRTPT